MTQSVLDTIEIYAGPRAREQLLNNGLRASDICAVAAAAGGPKGLSMLPLDRYIFGQFLAQQPSQHLPARRLYGASIGAWRMAAASRVKRVAALNRLEHGYLERQRYPTNPSGLDVSLACRGIVQDLLNHDAAEFIAQANPAYQLQTIVASSEQRASTAQYKWLFAKGAIRNTLHRPWLSKTFERHVWSDIGATDTTVFEPTGFKTLSCRFDHLNIEDALLASGTIPLLADPVINIAGIPNGAFWDGGLIDYHLCLNFNALPGLVLYPHFGPQITAGWLDKFLPWRKHGVGTMGQDWLSNVIIICPSAALLASLPNGKLPDRNDFYAYGQEHDRRIADWKKAIGQCQYMADALEAFTAKPDPRRVRPLPH